MIHFYSADVPVALRQRNAHRAWLTAVALERNHEIDSLAYIFCSDEYLLEMNKKFLDHDFYTDIITFPLEVNKNRVYAECYMSIDRIKDNAKSNALTFADELRRVMVHGLLHLIGEDDKGAEAERRMRKAEEMALKSWVFHVERSNQKAN